MKPNFKTPAQGFILILALPVVLLSGSCVSMALVNSTFESAKTLSPGQIELQGHYSKYDYRNKSEETGTATTTETSNKNVGFRAGVGISDRLDLKIRYERLRPTIQEDKDQLDGINYFSLTPRYSILKNYISGGIEFGLYSARVRDEDTSEETPESAFVFSPRIAFTYPSSQYFDLTFTTKADFLTGDYGGSYLGLNLGCGLSSNLESWAIRPEAGLMLSLDELSYGIVWKTIGVALILKLDSSKF